MLLERLSHSRAVERLAIERLNHNANGQVVLFTKFEVTPVVRRDGHNCSGAVLHQDEVPHPDLELFSMEWVNRVAASKKAFLFGSGNIFRFDRTSFKPRKHCFSVMLNGRAIEQL